MDTNWLIAVIPVIVGAIGAILAAIAKYWNQVKGTNLKDIVKQDNKEALETVREATHELGATIKSQAELIKEILRNREREKEKEKLEEDGNR